MTAAPAISRRDLLAACLAGTPLLLWMALAWPFTVDDAYIAFRHAWNWAHNGVLSYNPWGPPTEGFANFLHVCLAAALLKLGVEPAAPMKALGGLWGYATAPLTYLLCRRLAVPHRLALLATLLFALSAGFGFWAVAGLETAFYAFVFTLGVYLFLADTPRARLAAAAVFVAAALTRAEAPAFVGALGLVHVAGRLLRRERLAKVFASNLPWAALFLALFGAYFLARWRYFGHLLPNPMYWKAGEIGSWDGSVSAVFVRAWWPFLLVAPLSLFAVRARAPYRLAPLALVATAFAVFSNAQVKVAGDVNTMSYFSRYLAPTLPFLFAATALAFAALEERRVPGARWIIAATALALGAWQLFGPDANPYRTTKKARITGRLAEVRTQPVGEYLRARFGEKGVAVVGDAGRIPYVFRGFVFDLFGLNNYAYTLEFGKDMGRYVERIFESRPDAIVVCYSDRPGPEGRRAAFCQRPYETLTAHPDFAERYRESRVFGREEAPNYYYVVYERAEDAAPSP